MGFNSTVVILNDALHLIKEDPDFGKKLYYAITTFNNVTGESRERISVGGFSSVAEVIDVHHADDVVTLTVGGNSGNKLGYHLGWHHSKPEDKVRIVKELYEDFVLKPRRLKRAAEKKKKLGASSSG